LITASFKVFGTYSNDNDELILRRGSINETPASQVLSLRLCAILLKRRMAPSLPGQVRPWVPFQLSMNPIL